MNLFSKEFWKQFLEIAKPYWFYNAEGRKVIHILSSWFLLVLAIALILLINGINVYNSFITRDLIDLLEQREIAAFVRLLFIYANLLILLIPLVGVSQFIRKKIALDWYQFLNNYILDKYFQNRAYYKINFHPEIDNPDQRIAQELEQIPQIATQIFFVILERGLEIISFFVVIWSIYKPVAIIVLVYGVLGNLITGYLSQRLIKINTAQLEGVADYNYSLTHVRTNAESVAFFQGESQESDIVKVRFAKLIEAKKQMIGWLRDQQIFVTSYQSFLSILPFLGIAPLYFFDQIELGEVNQASTACNIFAGALSILVTEFGNSGKFVSLLERLSNFSALLDEAKMKKLLKKITTVESNHLELENVTLQTPNYERVIVKDLSVVVEPGKGLLIVGASGRGKSSLLRAIAGLWAAGSGKIIRPKLEDILFLPQRPYLILGTLREQLLYPKENRQIEDKELEGILKQVNLSDITSRLGGLDVETDWENILSLGEQQRLAFARLLVMRPRYVILDEATSALDLKNEEKLYQQLQQSGTTFISVGHRESLFNYHQLVLELSGESNWRLVPMEEYSINRELIILPETEPLKVVEEVPEKPPQKNPDLISLKIAELRQLCQEKGVKWRNARGQGKHLTKNEIVEILSEM
ncbi:MAG: ATP-binding cassette domain-containing protein [Aphanizomenon gracile PMC649.10]|jgi:vitamin B12/bleomycin/antimicrobial peptide transport system ATP-binding/permease protein|nr:ATP-binding cassette domain-containing protein [Aphanizomenon gracile PMC638.10]MDM3856887.1 ATP-binding cassette domain-containing protein [Aphanizomenon gracile PMC649.10]MDM3858331.1 ATP-binding cassette domain-containing protein [Aphanizomenon gracile PMC644.10]